MQQVVSSVLSIATCILMLVSLQGLRLQQLSSLQSSPKDTQVELDVSHRLVRLNLLTGLPKLGFDNLFADGIFLNFLQYFGDEAARKESGYGLSPSYFKPILAADPFYRFFYLFASGSTTIYGAMPERSVALLEQGLQRLQTKRPPDAYFVWRYKGTDELLFLGDTQSAQVSFGMAANWAKQSDHEQSDLMAEVSLRMVQALESNPNSRATRIEAWATLFTSAFDQATKQRAITEIRRLGGDLIIREDGAVQVIFPPEDELPVENQL